MKREFEKQKDSLLKEIRTVLSDVENLYEDGVERGEEEVKALKSKLKDQLTSAQSKLQEFEERAVEQVKDTVKAADDYVNDNPYYAMGIVAFAGLVLGILLNRR